jgi:hypothetical protein
VKSVTARILAIAAGGLVLWLLNLLLDPVPVAAGPAFVLGAACLLIPALDARRWILTVAATAGAVAGALVHRGWHLSGQSPPPAEGLVPHVLTEGLVGLLAALLALGVAVFVLRRWRTS